MSSSFRLSDRIFLPVVFVSIKTTCALILSAAGVLRVNASADEIDFNRDVRPILSDKCFHCHGPDESTREADLRFDSESNVRAERDGYFIVKPGDVENSELVNRITSTEEYEVMPPHEANKPLSSEEIAILKAWVAGDAAWSQHWAYSQPVKYETPEKPDDGWARNWIDHFIHRSLQKEKLSPSADADPEVLLRRVCFDLTGLPPSPEQAAKFLKEPTRRQFEQLVDELLASPHFGERMAIYWLDLVRYADTVGYHGDQDHNISPYRDWVIEAFNSDMRFDQFTQEQLAGDLLESPTRQQLIATGYNRLLQTTHEGGLQPREYRAIYAADRVRNVSAVWMGATVGCAQCHDHKFDPYTARDFYSLAAFFDDVDDERHFKSGTNSLPTRREPELELPTPDQARQIADAESQLEDLKKKAATEGISEEDKARLSKEVKSADGHLKRLKSQLRRTMITVALEQPRQTRVLPRGNWLDETGQIVTAAVPDFMNSSAMKADRRLTRKDLASWLVDTKRGSGLMTSRVMVNRFWYLLFGRGLAANLSDFGGQGEAPEHPELLDRLAHEFVNNDWSIKTTLKRIVLSRTYQQSSVADPAVVDLDPENRLFARQSSYRLPAEMVRDNALAISGLLVREIGGPSVKPAQPEGYYRHLNFPQRKYKAHTDERQWRRGLYVHWQRQFLHPMLKAFDAPSREECTAQRARSNTPLAALVMLNDPTFTEISRAFADRILKVPDLTDGQRLALAFQSAVNRSPTPEESDILGQLIAFNRNAFEEAPENASQFVGAKSEGSESDSIDLATWTITCRAILNLAETNTRN